MGVKVELEGMNELIEKINALGKKGALIEGKALKVGAEPVKNEMESISRQHKSNIHHTHISEDIQISSVKNKKGNKYVEVGPGKETNWRAKYSEFGTKKAKAIPFMGPAYERKKDEAKEIIKNTLKAGLGL